MNAKKEIGLGIGDAPTASTGKEPVHSRLFHHTRLAVVLKFDALGRNIGYHLDGA